jgi:hypothetical protein
MPVVLLFLAFAMTLVFPLLVFGGSSDRVVVGWLAAEFVLLVAGVVAVFA